MQRQQAHRGTEAAGFGRLDAHQPEGVGGVRVVYQLPRAAIASVVRVVGRLPHVRDDFAEHALRDRCAQNASEQPEDLLEILARVALQGAALNDGHSAAVLHLRTHRGDQFPQRAAAMILHANAVQVETPHTR